MLFINKKIREIPYISEFVSDLEKPMICGWGRKRSFSLAKQYAKKHNIDILCLEDGFIRSLGLGKAGYPPLSLVADQNGIYFDATKPSDLENLISQSEQEHRHKEAQHLIQKITQYAITKYNQTYDEIAHLQLNNKKNILVVDQTFGDQSIEYSGATADSFRVMLKQACIDHPDAQIWIKTHPDVIAKKAQGHFLDQDIVFHQVKFLTGNFNPIQLLKKMDEVYVVSSQLGFEALLCDKKVHCFGMPWYAGWGVTNDQYAPIQVLDQRRQIKRSLLHLFYCAYVLYARYVSPITHKRCGLEEILDILIPNIEKQIIFKSDITAYGFSRWKRCFLRQYLNFPNKNIKFKHFLKPKKNDYVVAWGKKARTLKQWGYSNVCTVEDGFIRSLGLGAALTRPCSLVFDPIGIYYDATQPSYLEHLISQEKLTLQQQRRTDHLIKKIINQNVSKYNVGHAKILQRPQAKRVILVVGQVEDDLSVQLGGVDIKDNLTLLKTVKAEHPDAYIIYKPHPDVHAGLRKGKITHEVILQYAHQIELDCSILECFKICDEVHTISSLSGFEALLRGLNVYCYGLPFYAGWGLTIDRHQSQRRNRKITLQHLVYMTLIAYPVYNIPSTKRMQIPLVTPESVIEYLQSSSKQSVCETSSMLSRLFTSVRRFKVGSK